MAAKKAKSPTLPEGAPQDVKDFVACTRLELQLDPTKLDWLPRPTDDKSSAPTVTVGPSTTPGATNAAEVKVGYSIFTLTLPVSVSGGTLQVDTSSVPDLGGIKSSIDRWVKRFNDWMKANGKELTGLEIVDGKVKLTKRAIAGATGTTTPGHSSNTTKKRAVGAGAALALTAAGVAYAVWPEDKPRTAPVAVATPTPDFQPTPGPTPGGPTVTPTPDPTPTPGDDFPADFWGSCAPPQPCFGGQPPLVIWTGIPGVTHSGSVVDPVTGRQGPSQTEWPFQILGPIGDVTTLQIQTQCGINIITGQSELAPDSPVSVLHPLFNYGQCQPMSLQLLGGAAPRIVTGPNWPQYNVGPAEVPTFLPDVDAITVPEADDLQAAGTTLGIISQRALDVACTWFRGPLDPSVTIPNCENTWVFTAGTGDDRVVAHGGGHLPIGPVTLSRFYECGPGEDGYTACPDDPAEPDLTDIAIVTVVLSAPLPELGDDTVIELGVGDRTVRLDRTGDDWSLDAPDPSARAILRGNSVTFMFDSIQPDISAYTISLDGVAQPPQPMSGTLVAPQAPALETPEDFVAQLSQSIATGNVDFAFDRLHPLVIEAFSADLCRAELEGRQADGYEITVDSVGGDAPWTWQLPDGRSFELPMATTVFLNIPGVQGVAESHFVRVDGEFRWFTICDGQ